MSRTWLRLSVPILGILLPTSLGLSAYTFNLETLSSNSLAVSLILAQDRPPIIYGCPGCRTRLQRFNYFEREGDKARNTGRNLFYGSGVRRDYNEAYNNLSRAVDYYNLCLSVEYRDSAPLQRRQAVERKRNNTINMREKAQRCRAAGAPCS